MEDMQSRHRKEQRELQSRITNKKKNATKKNRKGINDECAQLERQLKERQGQELAALNGKEVDNNDHVVDGTDDTATATTTSWEHEITQKLKETSVSSPPSSEPPPAPASTEEEDPEQQAQTQAQGQGQGKKRNRQKERMARRAAEQEAEAAAAEAEAAHMTDHRAREREGLGATLRAHGLSEREIRPDGHCLFAAVADQLAAAGVPVLSSGAGGGSGSGSGGGGGGESGEPPYRTVRRAATDYMLAHEDDFAPFLGEEEGQDGGFEGYVRKIRDTAEWGGQMELRALACAYGVEIRVLQDGRTETIEPSSSSGGGGDGEGEGGAGERKTIWLAYYRHGYGLGEHYNSLRQAS